MALRIAGFSFFDIDYLDVGIYFNWRIQLDRSYDFNTRNVYTLIQVMGNVGGLFNSLQFFGLLIYAFFRTPLFYRALVGKLFLLQQSSG